MSSSIDFAALLSKDYQPARLARLVPKEAFHREPEKAEDTKSDDGDDDDHSESSQDDEENTKKSGALSTSALVGSSRTMEGGPREEETSRLVLQLVSKTPVYRKHLVGDASEETARTIVDDTDLIELVKNSSKPFVKELPKLPSAFHQVELGDWESKIMWDGCAEEEDNNPEEPSSSGALVKVVDPKAASKPFDPMELLKKPRNPFLDDISETLDSLICWSGSKEEAQEKARMQPLLLELGVAGMSVARQALPSHRPTPMIKSEEYQKRMESDWTGEVTTADFEKGKLHADKEKMERLIAARQAKRRQMAKDKTSRVTEAMGTLNVLGSGRGRTITSSLMGPGGTERTGRPSRHVGSTMYDTEYIEQLDMIVNHSLVRDLPKVSQRQYHRPKIPKAIVRTTLGWQFQIRYLPSSGKDKVGHGQGGENASSYQTMMMGTHAGALSKAKLRTESDLTPTEGNLVLMEYTEERPPIQLTKGMSSKIVTYYRGDKSKCPVSAGGGDRPTRRKRQGTEAETNKAESTTGKLEKPPRLVGPDHALTQTTIRDWVGRPPKKVRDDRSDKSTINVLPEGITEILHSKVHGPFIGEVEEGQSITGLISNLFVAPISRHEPESTDFLMILGRNSGASVPGRHDSLGVVLREMPASMFTVGQTEPKTKVFGPSTQGEKNFLGPYVSYHIAKAIAKTEAREGHGLRFDEIQSMVLPNLGLQSSAYRQRLKLVGIYDKNTQIWSTKAIGYEDYPGVEALGKQISPEGVAAFEVSLATVTRLHDLGLHLLYSGAHAVSSVGAAMNYLAGQVNACKEHARKLKKLFEASRTNKSVQGTQLIFFEKAAHQLDVMYKNLRQRHEVAKFIYEELQLAPWHLSGEFIDVHKKGEGTGMMKLTGLGDPSGVGEGFSFIREADTKVTKTLGGSMQQNAQMKKITGTEDDLRKLTMKQMARILRSYGMAQKQIDTLKRWDRVHVIRDLSTKAASDGIGDGLERFARGEKMKLSEQKQMYRDRIKVIWKRQLASLAVDPSDGRGGADGVAGHNEQDETVGKPPAKSTEESKEDSDSESEDDDFAADLEEEMMDRAETNQLVLDQTRGGGDASLGDLRNAAQDKDLSKDARELAALMRQREEERTAQEGMAALATNDLAARVPLHNRKVIRQRVVKTFPDGRQTTTFKFIVHPDEVSKVVSRLNASKDNEPSSRVVERQEYPPDEKVVGHSIFEDDDDFEFSPKGRGIKKRGTRRGRGTAKTMSRKNDMLFGRRLKTGLAKDKRSKKRPLEDYDDDDDDDDADLEAYNAVARRKGTNNRKERGSIRNRRPHMILVDRLEAIRGAVEARPSAGPFIKPVNRRVLPRYYEVISNPIDLSTIRDRIQKFYYRSADAFLKDFELMKTNAIKFNGAGMMISDEAVAIYQYVKDKIEESRAELSHLEEAVEEQLSGKPKKKRRKKGGDDIVDDINYGDILGSDSD